MSKIVLQRNSQPGVPGATTPLLDTYPAFRAYSPFRKVRTGHNGPLIRVRRSSDNAEMNIGAVGYDLDVAALIAFAGSGSAYLRTIFDQSTNEVDIGQATSAQQPRIVNAGALEPGFWLDGVDDQLFTTVTGIYEAGSATVAAVFNGPTWASSATTGSATGVVYGEFNGSAASGRYMPIARGSQASSDFTRAGAYMLSNLGAGSVATYKQNLFDGTIHQATSIDTGNTLQLRGDGASPAAVSYARPAVTATHAIIGGRVHTPSSTAYLQAHIYEVIVWAGAKSLADVKAIEANQKAKFGTP